jgi:hypothetical protein
MNSPSRILLSIVLLLSACNEHNPTPGVGELNNEASLPASFNFSKMGLKVVCSTINQRLGTMSILYGNDPAKSTAQAGDGKFLPGTVFAFITWKQHADKRWIGANIPGQLVSVEILKAAAGHSQGVIAYNKFKGADLHADTDTAGQGTRIKYILGLKPSLMF